MVARVLCGFKCTAGWLLGCLGSLTAILGGC